MKKGSSLSKRFAMAAGIIGAMIAVAGLADEPELHEEPGGEPLPHLVVPPVVVLPELENIGPQAAERRLKIYNTHTKERAEAVYRRGGAIDAQGIAVLRDILKDHRTQQEHAMDPALFDLLADIQDEIKRRYPKLDVEFQMISGYRSPATNQMLKNSPGRGGQASNSRHTHGDAIDIRVDGVPRAELRNIAWCLQRGGVGDYPRDNFVHIDVYKQKRADPAFKGGARYRVWGWQPKPGQCGPSGP